MRASHQLGFMFALSLTGLASCTPDSTPPGPSYRPLDGGPRDGSAFFGGVTGGGSRSGGTAGDAGRRGGCEPLRRVLLLLDRSTSMEALMADGRTRYQVASETMASILRAGDPRREAGMLVFPTENFGDSEDPFCGDVAPLSSQFPFRPAPEMADILDALWGSAAPFNGTPRGIAIRRAFEGMPEEDLSDTLVLMVSDSGDGCGPAPGVADPRGATLQRVSITASTAVEELEAAMANAVVTANCGAL